MTDERPIPQTAAWYDRLAILQRGYHYPWRSRLGIWHGEDAYLAMVHQYLHPDADVLDVACGHGEVALAAAARVRSVLAYDRTAAWIGLAKQAARTQGITNATFVCHDSSADTNGGKVLVPAPDASCDLLICSKGPFHWIEDARRVARPGAILLMLIPDATPLAPWHGWLPETLQWRDRDAPHWARPAIERRLAVGGLTVDSWWSFDVPEVFADPEQLYVWLSWGTVPGEVPALAEVRPILDRVFSEYGVGDGAAAGVAIRRRRHLWKAVVPG